MSAKPNSGTRKPILQGGVAPRAWIIVPPRIEESFLELWFAALSEDSERHEVMSSFDNHWEYQSAVADLNQNCSMFAQYNYPMCWAPHIHCQLFLWRELTRYARHLNRVAEINRKLRELSKALAAAQQESERAASGAHVLQQLAPFFDGFTDMRLAVLDFEKNYWDRTFCLGPFAPTYDSSNLDLKFPEMRRLSDSLQLPSLVQERNLDSLFQIRIGDLLREYATNPWGARLSVLTISRLVLLVYICSGLAIDIEGDLTVWGSDPPRHLTVSRTYETLGDAGLR